ncbi:protein translocase subunit SecF [Breznakiella homolactica]|uniref:Protein-export membrane protein SecF n=1 Tax=Breznakiella homolactica TaxID=2798577 RepID=A0A7T7XRN4_9SPIR|nr:protein translocase subunit SecF [Breznakiella homolactica]QQO11213.1 protein translocase subunit SecF [Breznakiella homolactica]
MKRILPFSKFFLPAAILSIALIAAGLIGYVVKGGFNLGVDFQAGLIQQVQFAPTAFGVSYNGLGNASISIDRNRIDIIISGAGVEGATYSFAYASYGTMDALTSALSAINGIQVRSNVPGNVSSQWIIQSAQGNPQLGSEPYVVHYLSPNAAPIAIEDVRTALLPLGTVSVQVLGRPEERRFMIRMEDSEIEGSGIAAEQIIASLERSFGAGEVAVTKSDYVGSRFSKHLTDQAGLLMGLTLLLILVYASIRFKPKFAFGAVIAIAHDALIMVAFIVWSRMEFNTTTIAAILTILGYSINDTIVIFDRIRETTKLFPDDSFEHTLNRALSDCLGRTVITTVTTMLAVLSLFIFTTGSMKDFALALMIGMVSGVYSTLFIASGFVNFWDKQARKRNKKKPAGGSVPAPTQA